MKSYRDNDRLLFLTSLRYLRDKLDFHPNNLLDLGCSDGSLTLGIKNLFNLNLEKIFGLEYDDKRVKLARERGINSFQLDLNKDKIPFEDNELDLITANQVLEHIFELENLLSEVHRVLSPKGFFVLGTPNLAALHERLSLLFGYNPSTWHTANIQIGLLRGKPTNHREHVNGFTIKGLRYLLEYYGFEPVKLFVGKVYVKTDFYIPFLEKIFPGLALSQVWLCKVKK